MANDLALPGTAIARLEVIGIGRMVAAKMPTTVTAALHWRLAPVVGSDGQLDGLEVHDLKVRPGASREDLASALDVARQACRHAGPADAYAAVVPLVRLAAKRAEGDLDAALRREVWARELAEFPADVIAEAARGFMRRTHFLPHISELIAEIERVMALRRQLVHALERAVAEADAPKPDRQISRPEPPSRDRLRDVIAAWIRRGQVHRAAGADVELARLEGREPAEWATRPKPPASSPPSQRVTSMDPRLEPLAITARRRLLGEE